MRDEHIIQLRALFDEVFDLDAVDRQRYLDEHYARDAELRCALERLFTQEQAAATFLVTPVLAGWGERFSLANAATLPGAHIGPYRIERELGRGGMGVVYLAVRDDVFSKQVALKLVWPGLSQMADRFRQERQMLADLEHPHIARLLDGGTTAEGWQYLVMEYVEGISLTDYCEQKNLSIPARLELFLSVCAAVQHAHQRLIIHRDLKPGNILVTAEGQVKLLDFGIAKALDASAYNSELSLPGMHLMTPEYASPEQLMSAPVTTASDVYSLGVVLFELLTGQRPFTFPSRQPHKVAQVQVERAQAQSQRRELYAAEMKQSLEAWKNNDLVQMQKTLERWQPQASEEDLRGFEWRYLQHLINASSLTLKLPDVAINAALNPGANQLVVVLDNQVVKVFDTSTGQETRSFPGHEAKWGHNQLYASAELMRLYDQRKLITYDLLTGAQKAEITDLEGNEAAIPGLEISPNRHGHFAISDDQ